MKIISWNCNMAFRKKWHAVAELNPDILVLQECENESRYGSTPMIPGCNEFIWMGDNIHKGIGIMSFNHYHLERLPNHSDAFKYILPVRVTGPSVFNLFAIWAMPDPSNRLNGYVGQIWGALHHYEAELNTPCILAGDFNSNAIWDYARKTGNHSQVVSLLKKYGVSSVYHHLKGEAHGEELQPTLFLLKKPTMPFHLDYCFAPAKMITENTTIEVGEFEQWIKWSDHMPVIVDRLAH